MVVFSFAAPIRLKEERGAVESAGSPISNAIHLIYDIGICHTCMSSNSCRDPGPLLLCSCLSSFRQPFQILKFMAYLNDVREQPMVYKDQFKRENVRSSFRQIHESKRLAWGFQMPPHANTWLHFSGRNGHSS